MRRLTIFLLWCVARGPAFSAETSPLPESFLHTDTGAYTYTLEFHHTNMTPACRREAAEVTQTILVELMERDCTVFLSRPFLTAEIDYYRRYRTNENSTAVCDRLITTLSNALASGAIDWGSLRQLHTEAADVETISRGFPWLYPWRTMPPPKLAPETGHVPLLRYTFDWQSIAAQGVASVNRQAFVGRATLWKADAQFTFQGSQGEVGRHYPAPAWAKDYFGQETRPIPILMEQVLADLRRGLKPPPPPPPPASAKTGKKKRN